MNVQKYPAWKQALIDKLKIESETIPFCPNCKCPEVNPNSEYLFVRGFKVHDGNEWCSHCMRCHVWFGESGKIHERCRSDCYCFEIYADPEPGEYKVE